MSKSETESERSRRYTHERAVFLEETVFVEEGMNYFISAHFSQASKLIEFVANVLEDEYFSLHLRIRIFEKILNAIHPVVQFPVKELHQVQKFRNILAHVSRKQDYHLVKNEKPKLGETFYPYQGYRYLVDKLHTDFRTALDVVLTAMGNLRGLNFAKAKVDEATPEMLQSIVRREWKKKE